MKEYLISWSPLAEETYLNILSHILERWSIREAEAFEAKVESLALIPCLCKMMHINELQDSAFYCSIV